MNRLQKKCFIGATGLHLLLVVILLVGPAFFVADNKIDDSDVITFVPDILTDEKFSNPGATAPRPAPQPQPQPQPPQPQPQPIVEPPKPQPQPEPQPQPDPDPPKIETPKVNRPDPDSLETKPEKKKPQVKVSNTVVKLKPTSKTTTASKETAQATANQERQQQVASALRSIRGNLSATARVELPEGPGGGSGASYASYASEVRRVYTEACRIPPDVEDESAIVKVRVTIARNGNVISSSIVSPSGSAQLDRAIQATLDRVNFVAPFPQGAKDSQRTFVISFDLKAKKLLG